MYAGLLVNNGDDERFGKYQIGVQKHAGAQAVDLGSDAPRRLC